MSLSDEPFEILNVIRHPYGGVRSYLRYNYGRLDPKKYRLTVLTIEHSEAKVLLDDVSPIPTALSVVDRTRPFWRLVHRARKMITRGRFKIIHSQGLTASVATTLANAGKGVPHLVTLHETLRRDQFAGPFGRARQRFLAASLGCADRVILVSEDARDNLTAFLPLPATTRLEVSRNGVWVDALLKDARLARKILPPSSPPGVRFGFVGRFMPDKGFQILIEAVQRLRSLEPPVPRFQVFAVNDGAYVREYRREIAVRGLAESFVFVGLQSSVAGLLLSELDAVVMPSLREACPLVAMEALVLGCPLVASDCMGLREVTRGFPALVARAGDAGSLSEALRQVLQAPQASKRAALAYVDAARTAFDSSRSVARLEAIFAELAAPGSASVSVPG